MPPSERERGPRPGLETDTSKASESAEEKEASKKLKVGWARRTKAAR
jgi:hypothetical protein